MWAALLFYLIPTPTVCSPPFPQEHQTCSPRGRRRGRGRGGGGGPRGGGDGPRRRRRSGGSGSSGRRAPSPRARRRRGPAPAGPGHTPKRPIHGKRRYGTLLGIPSHGDLLISRRIFPDPVAPGSSPAPGVEAKGGIVSDFFPVAIDNACRFPFAPAPIVLRTFIPLRRSSVPCTSAHIRFARTPATRQANAENRSSTPPPMTRQLVPLLPRPPPPWRGGASSPTARIDRSLGARHQTKAPGSCGPAAAGRGEGAVARGGGRERGEPPARHRDRAPPAGALSPLRWSSLPRVKPIMDAARGVPAPSPPPPRNR